MSFDFTKLDFAAKAEEGAVMQVKNPLTGEALGATITLIGTDSKAFRDLAKQRATATLKRTKEEQENYDSDDEMSVMLSKCTLAWSGVEEGVEAVEFSQENALMMYRKYRWLRDQVDQFIGDRANFLPSA